MRRFLPLLLAALLVAAPALAARALPTPKVLAVYFTADWCVNCKKLSPEIDKARADGGLDAKDVLFVTFDLTDPPRIHQSILQAQALGLGEYLKAQGSATGYIALLDAATKKEIIRFDSSSSSDAIRTAIEKQLGPLKEK